ncbi:hypothetical protein LguiB_013552 [Lonicera macranthoides]
MNKHAAWNKFYKLTQSSSTCRDGAFIVITTSDRKGMPLEDSPLLTSIKLLIQNGKGKILPGKSSIHSPSCSCDHPTSLSRRLRPNDSNKKRGAGFENLEPSSPKVTSEGAKLGNSFPLRLIREIND